MLNDLLAELAEESEHTFRVIRRYRRYCGYIHKKYFKWQITGAFLLAAGLVALGEWVNRW
jgi:hypothetical protein